MKIIKHGLISELKEKVNACKETHPEVLSEKFSEACDELLANAPEITRFVQEDESEMKETVERIYKEVMGFPPPSVPPPPFPKKDE